MADARLTGSEKRALVLWVVFGALGLLFAQRYFFRAFPEASIDFKVSQKEAETRARKFLGDLGENVNDYKSSVVFEVDDNAKTYLERELGLQQANRVMSSEVDVWYWEVRFFRPLQIEEYEVRISPAGKVVAFEHKIEEARGAKSLSRSEALSSAEQFLRTNEGLDLDQWNFLPEEGGSEVKPNRIDWSFSWEKKGFKAKDAPYRLEVGLEGDRIGDAQVSLKVPEDWKRGYAHLRSTNDFYELVAFIPYGFLLGGALWLGVSLSRRGETRWMPAVKLGGLVAVLFLLMQLNEWNTLPPSYVTHDSYSSFLAQRFFLALLQALGTGLMVTLVLPGGEPLYRSTQPDKLRLSNAFSLRGLRSKEFFCSSLVGLGLAAAHIGFIVAFYMIGSKHGVWAPQDTNYSGAFNTAIPWIGGVAIGVTAATSEEFLFRLFAIPFLHKMTGSRVLAVILPAFFWGFLHSNYPQEPGYIRGLEVGLIGIVAGLVMLRWGILATLIWHYTVDASLVGLLLIRSDNLYYRISGVVVGLAAVAPLLWSGISYLLRGRFEPVDDLLNGAATSPKIEFTPKPPVAAPAAGSRRYTPLTVGMVGFLAACLVVGGLLSWRLQRESVGDYLKLSVHEQTAVTRADAVMKDHGLDPRAYRRAAELVNKMDPTVNEYLRRRISVKEINRIYTEQVPGVLWRVRYFKDSQPEEFAVVLRPDGALQGFWHKLAEKDKGASLDKDAARKIAEAFLREQKQIDLEKWTLVEDESKKQPNRIDHDLSWQAKTPLDAKSGPASSANSADHAYERMELRILGDEPVDFRTYIKIPDEFVQKQEEGSLPRTLFLILKIVGVVAAGIVVLVLYFVRTRKEPGASVPWRRLALWASFGVAAYLLRFLLGNGIPGTLIEYSTAFPWKLFVSGIVVRYFILVMVLQGFLVVLFGLAWHYAARAFGEESIPSWLGMSPDYYRDALWIGLGGSAALIGVRRFLDVASDWWPTEHRGLAAGAGQMFDAVFPAGMVIGGSILSALIVTGAVMLAAACLGAEVRVRWLRLVLFLALAAGLVSSWGSPIDFLKQFLANLILLTFVVFGMRRVVRFNVLGLFLIVAGTNLLGGALQLSRQTDGFYRFQAYLVLAVLALLLAWPLVAWRTGSGQSVTT
ncbi:MAG TPA: CPBP family intramembrane glutamic endopeptidase [Candidatus Acidoferrum sp.]|nr:CPBP family intramembrane glutamic endopeptidase [Candidatus Acidoferrum sp.]